MPPVLDIKRILARNAIWNYAGVFINLIVNVALFPLVVSRIGETSAGIWLLLASVTGYMGLLHLGTVPAVTQLAAAHIARGEFPALNRLVSSTLALLVGLGLLPMIVWPWLPAIVSRLNVPPSLQGDAVLVFRLGLLTFASQTPGHVLNAVLSGGQRQDRCAQAWMLSLTLKLIGTIAVLGAGYGLIGLMVLDLVLVVVLGAVLALLAFAAVPQLRLSWSLVERDDVRRVTGFGSVLFVNSLCTLIIEQTDRLVISAFLPVAMVTYYSAGWKMYMLARIIPSTLLFPLSPVAAALAGRGATGELKTLVLRMTKLSAGPALALAFAMGLSAPAILRYWMGPSFVPYAAVVHVLMIWLVVDAFNSAADAALLGTRRIGAVVWAYYVPQAIANLALSLWLVTPLGLTGVALGTVIPAIVLEPIFLRIIMRELQLTWREWLTRVVAPVLKPAVAFVPAILVYATAAAPDSLTILVVTALCTLAYAAAFYGTSLDPQERAGLRSLTRASTAVTPAVERTPSAGRP